MRQVFHAGPLRIPGTGSTIKFNRIAAATLVTILWVPAAFSQAAPSHKRAAPQSTAQQNSMAPFKVGDAIQIQAPDGTWIHGTIQSVDAVRQVRRCDGNGQSGLVPVELLHKAARAPAVAAPSQTPLHQQASMNTQTGKPAGEERAVPSRRAQKG